MLGSMSGLPCSPPSDLSKKYARESFIADIRIRMPHSPRCFLKMRYLNFRWQRSRLLAPHSELRAQEPAR